MYNFMQVVHGVWPWPFQIYSVDGFIHWFINLKDEGHFELANLFDTRTTNVVRNAGCAHSR